LIVFSANLKDDMINWSFQLAWHWAIACKVQKESIVGFICLLPS